MKELLTELKKACQSKPSSSESETIARGRSSWFKGRPSHAAEGTIALALNDDVKIIINEGDVLDVKKDDDGYSVNVSAEAHFLVRIEKLLKATPSGGSGDSHGEAPSTQQRRKPIIDIDIGPIQICDLVCWDFVLDGRPYHICVPMNCRIENQSR